MLNGADIFRLEIMILPFKHKLILFLLLFSSLQIPVSSQAEMDIFFYRPKPYGSEAFYNPLNLSFSYFLDTVQLSENFDTDNFSQRWDEVRNNLTHPLDAIEEEGGTRAFINRQIFPVDSSNRTESYAIIPNYFLHLFGGGMVYRKDAEYFQEHGYPAPRLCAAALAMAAEIIQEVVEKKSTTSDDEVADVLLFRPLGILLFSSDTVAGFVDTHLSPAIWPHLLLYDFNESTFINTGINYVIRPKALGNESVRFFSFIGLNNLLGLSHKTAENSYLSWGAGLATTRVDLSLDIPAEFRFSAGMFYDKNNSLLWSAIFNGTENLKVRLNLYPIEKKPFDKLGFFAGVSDDREFLFGATLNIPVGPGISF